MGKLLLFRNIKEDIFWNSLCIESPALHHYRVHATWEGAKPPYTLGGGSEVMDAEEEENIDDYSLKYG